MSGDPSSVTVLMAVLNGEPYLAEALAGLAAQTHPAARDPGARRRVNRWLP